MSLSMRLAIAHDMDRLVQVAPTSTDRALCALAEVELALEPRRRWRRRLMAATAVASVLCWVYAVRAYVWLSGSSLCFAVLAGVTGALFISERSLARRRDEIVASMPPELRARIGP
jgi:hypothetical protein